MTEAQTFYEEIGGFETFRRIVARFYEGVAMDPVLVVQSRAVMTETLAAFLLAGALAASSTGTIRGAALSGLWFGLWGPAKMPAEVTRKLHGEIAKAMAQPALQQRLANEAIDPMPMSSEEFGAYIQAEIKRWSALARERNIRLDE